MAQPFIVRSANIAFTSARPLGGVCLALVMALLASWLRYHFIEPAAFGTACEKGALWWCAPRTALIVGTKMNLLGFISLLAAALAFLPKPRVHLYAAHLGLAFGGAGMVLYNATFSSVAFVLCVLILALRREQTE